MNIASWLRELGLERYVEAFAANDIDAAVLRTLNAEDLKELGVASLGHRKKLLEAIGALEDCAGVPTTTGAEIGPAVTVREAERRQLTVMFCDLVGSTALAARLDPEDLGEAMRSYQRRCTDVVTRWGGHVAKYMGDGVLAYFGWPHAHEDDAERAVRAGLELAGTVGEETANDGTRLAARIGIATGLVVVGDLIGEGAAREEAVVGETPNLAARLQTLAGPGAVVVAAGTRQLLGGLFELADLGGHDLKGFSGPVLAWRVTGIARIGSRFETIRRGRYTPLVGRGRELEVLEQAFEHACDGRGQLVAVVGEPGVGKSRLLHAFTRSAIARQALLLEAAAVAHGADTAWLPILELLRDHFGIKASDEADRVRARIVASVVELDPALEAHVPPLLALFDLPVEDREWQGLEPPQRRRRTLIALKALLIRLSRTRPLILVFEDLHWVDGETGAVLDALVDGLPTSRMLLLVSYRPDHQHGWGSRTYYTQIRIDPLDREDAERLLGALVGSDPGLDGLRRLLIQRAAGNPLFLEESARALAEEGALEGEPGAYRLARDVDRIDIPGNVQAIIAARIDRLGPESKRLLQAAAVIGETGPIDVLKAAEDLTAESVETNLIALQRAEMLYETGVFPDLEFAFRHPHIREVGYDGLLRSRRRALHGRVARVMEDLYPGRRAEMIETLARHYELAENSEEAVAYLLMAAEKAKRQYTYPRASDFAERALNLADRTTRSSHNKREASVLLGDLASLMGDLSGANRRYDHALGLAEDQAGYRRIVNKRHEPRIAVRDGARIAYYEHGTGEPAIVLVTGATYGLIILQPVIERLCQDFRIITIDLRGSGASDPIPDGGYSMADHMADVRAVIENSGAAPVVMVGSSRGGNLAVKLAVSAPELVAKVVTVASALDDMGPQSRTPLDPEFRAKVRAAIEASDFERALRIFIPTVISEPGFEDWSEQFIQNCLRMPPRTLLSFFSPDAEVDIAPILERVQTPTLVMHGTADRRVPVDAARYLVDHLPDARLHLFEGKGHMLIYTATAEFCDVLRDFVRQPAPVIPIPDT